MKLNKLFIFILLSASLLFTATACDDEETNLDGVWKLISMTEYDDDTGNYQTTTLPMTDGDMTLNMYIKVANSKSLVYLSVNDVVYSCDSSTMDMNGSFEVKGNTIVTGNEEDDTVEFELNGDDLTVYTESDDDKEKIVLKKVDKSVLDGATENCELFEMFN